MNNDANSEAAAERAALELRLLAAYLDDHDAGRVPANAGMYQVASQNINVLLGAHMANPRIQRLCHTSLALHQILCNLLIEQEPDMASDLKCALKEANLSFYWL